MKTKLIFLLFITIYTTAILAQDNATTILEKAYAQAKTENKNVFVKFSASWCGWCKKMDNQIKSENCKSLFDDNYVFVQLTVNEAKDKKHLETPGALEFLTLHKGDKAGLPFWLVLDSSGNLLEDSYNEKGENLGCPSSNEEIKTFITILNKTSKLTINNLATIAQEFSKK